jgi:hypothetical protein
MTTYKNDPRRIQAKFNSICHTCHMTIKKGSNIIYWPLTHHAGHFNCDESDYLQALASFQDEESYNNTNQRY